MTLIYANNMENCGAFVTFYAVFRSILRFCKHSLSKVLHTRKWFISAWKIIIVAWNS